MRANGSNIEIGLLLNIDYRVDWDRLSHIPGRPAGRTSRVDEPPAHKLTPVAVVRPAGDHVGAAVLRHQNLSPAWRRGADLGRVGHVRGAELRPRVHQSPGPLVVAPALLAVQGRRRAPAQRHAGIPLHDQTPSTTGQQTFVNVQLEDE